MDSENSKTKIEDTMMTTAMDRDDKSSTEMESHKRMETGEMERVFGKKPKVPRSPVPKQRQQDEVVLPLKQIQTIMGRPRSTSLTNMDLEQSGKRKRLEVPPNKTESEDRDKASMLKSLLDKIYLQSRTIGKIVEDTYNCKRELKEAVGKLVSHTDTYLSKQLKERLEEIGSGSREQNFSKELNQENVKLKKQIASMKKRLQSWFRKLTEEIVLHADLYEVKSQNGAHSWRTSLMRTSKQYRQQDGRTARSEESKQNMAIS